MLSVREIQNLHSSVQSKHYVQGKEVCVEQPPISFSLHHAIALQSITIPTINSKTLSSKQRYTKKVQNNDILSTPTPPLPKTTDQLSHDLAVPPALCQPPVLLNSIPSCPTCSVLSAPKMTALRLISYISSNNVAAWRMTSVKRNEITKSFSSFAVMDPGKTAPCAAVLQIFKKNGITI